MFNMEELPYKLMLDLDNGIVVLCEYLVEVVFLVSNNLQFSFHFSVVDLDDAVGVMVKTAKPFG